MKHPPVIEDDVVAADLLIKLARIDPNEAVIRLSRVVAAARVWAEQQIGEVPHAKG
jgi:hypothetical protein